MSVSTPPLTLRIWAKRPFSRLCVAGMSPARRRERALVSALDRALLGDPVAVHELVLNRQPNVRERTEPGDCVLGRRLGAFEPDVAGPLESDVLAVQLTDPVRVVSVERVDELLADLLRAGHGTSFGVLTTLMGRASPINRQGIVKASVRFSPLRCSVWPFSGPSPSRPNTRNPLCGPVGSETTSREMTPSSPLQMRP